MAMDKLNTKVSMSLHDYENLKEFQQNSRDIHKEITSMVNMKNRPDESIEITINRDKLEKFLMKLLRTDIQSTAGDKDKIFFQYE
jgi:hypothetical protein